MIKEKYQFQINFKFKAIKELKAAFQEKVDSPEYDRFWLESQMEKMKVDDMISLKEKLDGVSKKDGLNALKEYMTEFEAIIEDRKKQNKKEDKERNKVIQLFFFLTLSNSKKKTREFAKKSGQSKNYRSLPRQSPSSLQVTKIDGLS